MRRRSWPIVIACVAVAPLAVAIVLLVGHDVRRAEAARPLFARDQDYVGASACRACHPDRYASWRRTYHATMTQLPGRDSVLGQFDGVPVTMLGGTVTPLERDGRFFFELPAVGARPPRRAEVALCVGSRRYQQYFERTDDADGITYRRLPLLWHVGERRWMHVNAVFLGPDDEDFGAYQAVWNANCIFCHNTGVRPGLTAVPGGAGDKHLDSHVADLGIACEACHGPGRDHVLRNGSPLARFRAELGLEPIRDIVDPLRLGQAESAALCGQCHAQRLPDPMEKIWTYLDTGPSFRPGGVLAGHVKPVSRETPTVDPAEPDLYRDRFWSDGTARLTAYEYQGLTQSPCFRGGRFTCSSCHAMHRGDPAGQIDPGASGDRACTQCHEAIARDGTGHTHHPAASSGSRCLACHMPRIVYGVLTVHRSHRVESPDVRRDVEGGRPDACTGCHLDRSALWAADRMRDFWGARYERPRTRPDGAPLELAEALASLHAGDPVQRAVEAVYLGSPDAAGVPAQRGFALVHALVAMGDGYPAVRYLARQAALHLDAQLGLGLAGALRAFDTLGPRERRDPELAALFGELRARARGRLEPPPSGMLVSPDWSVDLPAVRELLRRQAGHAISIGE